MSKTVQEKLKNETNPYVISTLLMADEAGIEVSDVTLALLKMDEEVLVHE